MDAVLMSNKKISSSTGEPIGKLRFFYSKRNACSYAMRLINQCSAESVIDSNDRVSELEPQPKYTFTPILSDCNF